MDRKIWIENENLDRKRENRGGSYVGGVKEGSEPSTAKLAVLDPETRIPLKGEPGHRIFNANFTYGVDEFSELKLFEFYRAKRFLRPSYPPE